MASRFQQAQSNSRGLCSSRSCGSGSHQDGRLRFPVWDRIQFHGDVGVRLGLKHKYTQAEFTVLCTVPLPRSEGDALGDAALFQRDERTDLRPYRELYGLDYQQVLDYSTYTHGLFDNLY